MQNAEADEPTAGRPGAKAPDGHDKIDMISQLQDHLSGVCLLFVNFTGAIQRDAPPVSVGNHAVEPELLKVDRTKLPDTKELAGDLLQAFKTLDILISQVPNLQQTENHQLQEIAALQDQNDNLAMELRQQAAAVEKTQQQVQELYGSLASCVLR